MPGAMVDFGVTVALAALIVQGVKAAWDIGVSFRDQKATDLQRRISVATVMFELVDASAMTAGDKGVAKRRLAESLLGGDLTVGSVEAMHRRVAGRHG